MHTESRPSAQHTFVLVRLNKRYIPAPKNKTDKKRLGTRLLGLIPGRHGDQNNDGNTEMALEQGRFPPGGRGGGDGSASGHVSPRQLRAAGTVASIMSPTETLRDGRREPETVDRTTIPVVNSETVPSISPAAIDVNGEENLRVNGEGTARGGSLNSPASAVATDPPTDGKGGGFNIAGMVSGWGKLGVAPPPAATTERNSGKSQPPKRQQQQQQRETQRPPNQQQQQRAADKTSAAASSSTPVAGGTGKFSDSASVGVENKSAVPGASTAAAAAASVPSAAISEVEKRARQYVQEREETAKGPKAESSVGTSTENVVEGKTKPSTEKKSPTASSRTRKAPEARTRSAKVDNQRSATLPNENNNAAGGAVKDSGNPFVVGPGSR